MKGEIMPRTVANFKCNNCGDIFVAKSDKFYECACGQSRVRAKRYSTEYDFDKGNHFQRMADGNDHTYYDQNDIILLEGDLLSLYEKVKGLAEKLDFYIFENFEYDEDGRAYLESARFSKYGLLKNRYESNEVILSIRFEKEGKENEEQEIRERLVLFVSFLEMFGEKGADISDRKSLLSTDFGLEWQRKPVGAWDYEFFV
jgi:hypothetical protein